MIFGFFCLHGLRAGWPKCSSHSPLFGLYLRWRTFALALTCVWLAQVDSNHRPRAYQARALTTWAMSQFFFNLYARFLMISCGLLPFSASSSCFYTVVCILHSLVSSPIFGSKPALGGDDGIRTHDPLLAGQVLSQLSYTPIFFPWASLHRFLFFLLQGALSSSSP